MKLTIPPGICPDCYQPYDGVACICQAPWLFNEFTVCEAFNSAMREDDAMRTNGRTPIEGLRKSLGLSPGEAFMNENQPYRIEVSK